MSWFYEIVPYILALGTIALGAFELKTHWKEYKRLKNWVAGVFILVGVLSIASLYHDSQEKKETRIKAEGDMKVLQGKADVANQAQKDNTKLYVDSFGKMSDQISDLKTQVKTEALQKKLDTVQTELLNTQKAMAPGPKAELTFTFQPFDNPPPPQRPTPTKEVTVPLNSDGSIHVEFSIANATQVDATDVEINLIICDSCKFAKEPPGMSKLPGMKETARFLGMPSLHALEVNQAISLDIIPPPGISQMQVGFDYRCHTCILHQGFTPQTSGIIHIKRP
jgi:hypothetical protein